MNARKKFKIGQEVKGSLARFGGLQLFGTVVGFGRSPYAVRIRKRGNKSIETWFMDSWDVVPAEQPAPTIPKSRKNEKRTPEEIALGIPGRCVRAWRAICFLALWCYSDLKRQGWGSTDQIVIADSGHADTGRKARLLAEKCPDAVRRAYQDRKTGKLYFCEWKDLPGHVDALALYRPVEPSEKP